MRKLVSLCFLALFAMVCSFFLPFASAEQTTVSYSIRTEDMFPIIERVDLILQTEWNVDFNADDGSVGPGETVEYPITASPALGSISVEWWYNGTVLTGHNSQTVPHQTPIGDEADIPIYDDGLFSITLTIHSDIEASISSSGPGSVSPSSAVWTTWEQKTFQVTANEGAQNGQQIGLSSQTTYTEDLTVTFTVIGIESLTADLVTKSGEGDKTIANTITVVVPTHTISGYVYRSGTSQGIPGAAVSASPGSYSATADSNGYYFLTLPDGTYTLSVTATGYHSTSALITVSGSDLTKDFYLAPIAEQHTISGHIYEIDTSQGIAGAAVSASPGGYSTISDSAGYYSLSLPDGSYTVTVEATGYQSVSSSVIVSGSDVVKDFYLTPTGAAPVTITGHVYRSGTSQGIPGATVSISPGGQSTLTDSTGFYSLTVEVGSYTVAVSATGYQSSSASITVSGSDMTKDFYLTPLTEGDDGGKKEETAGMPIWVLLIPVALAIVVGVTIVFLLRRRKTHPPSPPSL